MNNLGSSYEPWRTSILETINRLYQKALYTSGTAGIPSEALALAYDTLTDEQKISFILAGGFPSLFQQQAKRKRTGRSLFERDTDQLPILC
jgi:hypothetical protein